MQPLPGRRAPSILWLILAATQVISATPPLQPAVALPPGVEAAWDAPRAFRDTTPTRERLCLNGLWRWQPATNQPGQIPASQWGYFKVPGPWPGITDYMQKDSQTVFTHPDWANTPLARVRAAWYERTFDVPASWTHRRILLQLHYLNSYAEVFVDGQPAGPARFPAAEIDLTALCRPGATHCLSLHVLALPLRGVSLSYTDSAAARSVQGAVPRRGLCGDVFLESRPQGPRIAGFHLDTSVRQKQLTLNLTFTSLAPAATHTVRATILKTGRVVREFASRPFTPADLPDHQLVLQEPWLPPDLWDLHTPHHTYDLQLSLHAADGQILDAAWPTRFGFRELWIQGRDFYLNGSRLHLSAVPLDNAQVSAAQSTYAAARESLERLRSFGINYVYTHHYNCTPGAHLALDDTLRAADDVGLLVGLTQPHFSDYEWPNPHADQTNGYATHAAFYTRVAGTHPSVVFYPMSHNATGYHEDMNPDLMDGRSEPRDSWAARNVLTARRAEAIVRSLDPSRLIYHHASGNLGPIHNSNFYPNFTPIQELCDWFEPWATHGAKPVFTCEYGAPFSWDWTLYRGWYQGEREFGSARVPWDFCLAEWNAQFLGDRAYAISDAERANLRWEAEQYRAGARWHRWDYPHAVGSDRFDERYPIFSHYLTDTWRAYRTWGVSGTSPWDFGHFWKLRPGVDRDRRHLPTDWSSLQKPGFSPDYEHQRYERMDLAFERSDWIATPAAQALFRNNRPLLAYLAGPNDAFTSKAHLRQPGESFEHQIILINDSRLPVACSAAWKFQPTPNPTPSALPPTTPSLTLSGSATVTVPPGDQARLPIRLAIPPDQPAGPCLLELRAEFDTGETQTDTLRIDVLPRPTPPVVSTDAHHPPLALLDPHGRTATLLRHLNIPFQQIDPSANLPASSILLVGQGALDLHHPALDLTRVREGLKVLVFEQTAPVLEQRFGFRVVEYGLRQAFPRVADHPVLAGLHQEHLRDWRGEATLLPPRLSYTLHPRLGPTVSWCGFTIPHAWRCGNRGNVASVLIEKPARGDFLPLVDGGFSLQYSPLLEYREGQGLILFCQLDVTARTDPDPAAQLLVANLLRYLQTWHPPRRRTVVYAGDPAGLDHLQALNLTCRPFSSPLTTNDLLVVGPGGGRALQTHRRSLEPWLAAGGPFIGLGLDQDDADALFKEPPQFQPAEHIATSFPPFSASSPLAGIAPADVHNRDPRLLPLIVAGATPYGNGVLAQTAQPDVVFLQLTPWSFAGSQPNLRRTHRRASFALSRLLANLGAAMPTPLLERFRQPLDPAGGERRWRTGLYLDQPEEWDNPYRFFRW